MWLKTIQQDLKSNNLSLSEATNASSTLETTLELHVRSVDAVGAVRFSFP